MSSFTHPYIIPNQYNFICSALHKYNVGNQTVLVTIDFHFMDKKYWDISSYLKSYRFKMTCRWNDKSFHFLGEQFL